MFTGLLSYGNSSIPTSIYIYNNEDRRILYSWNRPLALEGGGMVSTAAFHAKVRGSVPGLGGLKKTKCFFHIHV